MAKPGKKRWFTIAWLDREGNPHPAFRHENFKQTFRSEGELLEDLAHGMRNFNPHGAYVAMVWEGKISGEQAMASRRPHFHIWENGDMTVVT